MGVLSGCFVIDCTNEQGTLCIDILKNFGVGVIPVNPAEDIEQEDFRVLIKKADILVETYPPSHLENLGWGFKDLQKINPALIMVSITPFGQSGPYKDFKASDITLQAMGGWLSITGEANAPLKLYGNQAYKTASLFAANGIMLALLNRRTTSKGQHVDISIMECVAATLDHTLVRYFYGNIVSGRQGSRHWNNAFEILSCRDGFILISLHQQWDTLVEWLRSEGMAFDLTDEEWKSQEERNLSIDHIIQILERWTMAHSVKALVEKGQLMHFPWAEVVVPKRESPILKDEQKN